MTACLETQPVLGPITVKEPGWTGAARSNAEFTTDGWFGWEVPRASVGVALGLNTLNQGEHYNEFSHGFLFQRGTYRIIESGAIIAGPISYPSGTRFYLMRVGTDVLYMERPPGGLTSDFFVDSRVPGVQLPGNVLRISAAPSTGVIFLDASIYQEGDRVLDEAAGFVWYPGSELDTIPVTAAGANLALTFIAQGVSGLGATAGVGYLEIPFESEARSVREAGGDVSLPFEIRAADIPLTAYADVEIPFESTAYGNFGDTSPGISGGLGIIEFVIEAGTSLRRAGSEILLPLEVFALSTMDAPQISSGAMAELPFAVFGTSSSASQDPVTSGSFLSLPFNVFATGSSNVEDPITAGAFVDLPFSVFGTTSGDDELAPQSFMFGELTFDVYGITSASGPQANTFNIAFTFTPFAGAGADFEADVAEQFFATDTAPARYVNKFIESLYIASRSQTFYTLTTDLAEEIRAYATQNTAIVLEIAQGINVAGEVAYTQVISIAEELRAAGVVQSLYQGILAVLSGVLVSDASSGAYAYSPESALTVDDDSTLRLTRVALEVSAITAAAALQSSLTIIVEESAALLAEDSVELTAQLFAEIMDAANVYSLLKLPTGLAQGWAMNTEGAQPISEYSNFEFNALTSFKGRFYGTTDEGLFVMGADDDAGTNITAELSTMMLDMGTSRLKNIRSAYLGYTSTNKIVLKVRSVDDGVLVEHWYEACPVNTSTPRTGYFRPGRGMRSRYWQFELTNVDGGDFEIDQLELHPLMLSRRV